MLPSRAASSTAWHRNLARTATGASLLLHPLPPTAVEMGHCHVHVGVEGGGHSRRARSLGPTWDWRAGAQPCALAGILLFVQGWGMGNRGKGASLGPFIAIAGPKRLDSELAAASNQHPSFPSTGPQGHSTVARARAKNTLENHDRTWVPSTPTVLGNVVWCCPLCLTGPGELRVAPTPKWAVHYCTHPKGAASV